MDRKIIINADDFGLNRKVNKAIAAAYSKGVVTSTTIIANMPAATDAVKTAKGLEGLGVGVHLNIFEGKALSKDSCVESLLDSKARFALSPAKLAFFSSFRHDIRKAIKTEMAAQIQWAFDNGLEPTHLDSHKHIHCFPAVFAIVCQLAEGFGISAIRFGLEPKAVSQMPWPLSEKKEKKVACAIRNMAKINRIQNSKVLKTDALLGAAHMGRIDTNFFRAVSLYNRVQITEIMTHPGGVSQGKDEFSALCSEKTKQYLEDGGVELVHYGQL